MKEIFTKDDENLCWKTTDSKTILNTVVFDVTKNHNVSHNGIEGDYIVLKANDWVIVVPEVDDKLVMVKQWRHGEQNLSIEFPGGVIDKNEEPEKAALRELEEETGCKAQKLIKLGKINPNPALFSNHLHIFLAKDIIKTGVQHLDKDEFINTVELTMPEVLDLLGTEHFSHGLMGTALAFYMKSKQ
jgi:8-oxo-dGTP pyrophosphatase MutT (NUDIX family)